MADYIYTMELRLTPDQQRGVTLVQDIARAAGMNVYLSGGAVRDILSNFPIRDLDFTVQGNPFKLQKDLERSGVEVVGLDEDTKTLHLTLPGRVRAELGMARTERYEKVGKPPVVTPATMLEDLRRRDFTVNAMALSLNPGSRGLMMDPFNGAADIETKSLRILHNYSFVEDPSRLIRLLRFAARFQWTIEEKTQSRFESAKENKYIDHIAHKAIGYEISQLAYEDDPVKAVKALENEGWLKILHEHWTTAKMDTAGLTDMAKTRQQMTDLGYNPDPSAAVIYFLTAKLGDKDIKDIQKAIPRKDLVTAWKDLEDDAKEFAKRLTGKEAATPSKTWKLLSEARQDLILFLDITSKQQAVTQRISNFFTKWRQVQQRLPLPEMTELLITPQMPEYKKIANDVFMLLLDGKLRSQSEIMKYLKPLAPPPPPPPPPPRRGRGAKAAAVTTPVVTPGKAGKKKGKEEAAVAAPGPTVAVPVPSAKKRAETVPAAKEAKPHEKAKPAHFAKAATQKAPAKKALVKKAAKPVKKEPARKAPAKKSSKRK